MLAKIYVIHNIQMKTIKVSFHILFTDFMSMYTKYILSKTKLISLKIATCILGQSTKPLRIEPCLKKIHANEKTQQWL